MHDMPRKLPLHVCRERDRHGVVRFYFRRGKGKRTALPAPTDPGFMEAYHRALEGAIEPKRRKIGVDTLEWLIREYRQTAEYQAYARATRRQRDNIYEQIVSISGSVRYKDIKRQHIIKGKERRKETPAQARNFLDAMRCLFRWAVADDLLEFDPTEGVANPPRPKGDGFPMWEQDEVDRYENCWPIGTKERVWFAVLRYTGARRGDAVLLGKQHVKNGMIAIGATEKTGETAFVPMRDELAEILEAGPTGDLAFICGTRGDPLRKESFGNMFKQACLEADVEKSAHGLRKFAATEWAEIGLSVSELESIFGWKGGTMASYYTRAADRKRLAEGAARKLSVNSIPRTGECNSPNLKKSV